MKSFRIVLALLVIYSSLITAQAMSPTPLNDISGHQYEDEILAIQREGIVQGYSDQTYRPDNFLNRAEFTKIIIEAVYTSSEIQNFLSIIDIARFNDVDGAAWFADYVYMAAGKGIIKGYDNGNFEPSWNINFAEGSKIVTKAFGLTEGPGGDNWYDGYLQAIRSSNALPPSFLQPAGKITRGEMAYMVAKVLGLSASTQTPVIADGEYYENGAGALDLNDGQKKILFFHASWCPKCRENAQKLTSWYSQNDYTISTYQLNYDTETELRSQFGVTGQDTFILVDEAGEVLETTRFPRESELQAWLE